METLHILTRVSSQTQTETKGGTSLTTQKQKGIELSKTLDMNYEIHNEGGTSSSNDTLESRPVLLNLLKKVDKGEVKNIYVWNTDRLSRNTTTWFLIRKKMVDNGVVLYTSTGKYDTTGDMENLILGILSEISQYDNKIRSERSRLGKLEKVKLNYYRGGDPPFGYKIVKKEQGSLLIPDEIESYYVRMIYNLYVEEYSTKEIKKYLEKKGVKTRRGNENWSLGSIQVILRNPSYTGIETFKDKKTGQVITSTIPSIISKKLFEKVQERRKQQLLRRGQFNRTVRTFLFRNYLFCSCGRPIGGRVNENKGINHYYCPLSERNFKVSKDFVESCDMKKCLEIEYVENFLWKSIVEIISDTDPLVIEFEKNLKSDTMKFSVYKGQTDKRVRDGLVELKDKQETITNSLVQVEKQNLLIGYSSPKIYKSLKNSLESDLNKVYIEIEEIKGLEKRIGKQNSWIRNFIELGTYFRGHKTWSNESKIKVLKTILNNVVVSYNHEDLTHELSTTLKIPIDNYVTNSGRVISTPAVIKSLKTPLKSRKSTQISADYSTVTDFARFLG